MSYKIVKNKIVPIKYYLALLLCCICLATFSLLTFILNHLNMMPYPYEAIAYTFQLTSSGGAMVILIIILVSYRHVHTKMRAIDIGLCVIMSLFFFFSVLYYMTLFGVYIKYMPSIMGVVLNIILFAVAMLCLGFAIAIYIVNDKVMPKHGRKK